MVNKTVKNMVAVLLIGSMAACTNNDFTGSEDSAKPVLSEKRLSLSICATQSDASTRAIFDKVNTCTLWTAGETIGVAATCNGAFTDVDLQPFVGGNDAAVASTTFSGSLGDGGAGTYQLYAASPFKGSMHTTGFNAQLPNIQCPEENSWDPTCDFMLGHSAEQTCSDNVAQATEALTFSHKVGWVCLSFTGFGASQTEEVQYVRISADAVMAGHFTVDVKQQSINTEGAVDKFILADYTQKHITLNQLNAYLTLFPGTYENVSIAVKTTGHYIECDRTDLTIVAGQMSNAAVTCKNGDRNETNQGNLCGSFPSPRESLNDGVNVLLLGHSFGLDCIEYVPNLLEAAGITNANLCRFYSPDCSLERYWEFITEEGCPQNFGWWEKNWNVESKWNTNGSTKVTDKLAQTAWDVIIFQQSTPGLSNVFVGSADYSTYQPWLSLLMEYAVTTQKTRLGKTPFIGWNMIHAYRNHTAMYNDMVTATTSMQNETGIEFILTPATAMETARETYTGEKYKLLCRDNWHASIGLGRYLEACTWFEQLFVPLYDNAYKAAHEGTSLTVQGNTYRPTLDPNRTDYFVDDEVDDTQAAILQQIAHQTALENPFK